jgi:hypothetical protein
VPDAPPKPPVQPPEPGTPAYAKLALLNARAKKAVLQTQQLELDLKARPRGARRPDARRICDVDELPGGDKIPHPKKRVFLAAYAVTCNVAASAKAAAVTRTCHYDWLERDADYKAVFAEAHKIGVASLEDEVVRRAYLGVDEPVFHQPSERCGRDPGRRDATGVRCIRRARSCSPPRLMRQEVSAPHTTAVPTARRFGAGGSQDRAAGARCASHVRNLLFLPSRQFGAPCRWRRRTSDCRL